MRRAFAYLIPVLVLLPSAGASAQTLDTLFFENLTFDEIRARIQGGARNVILATGGTEDQGPYAGLGRHNHVVAYAADRIARALGDTLIAPVIAYAPRPVSALPANDVVLALPEEQGYLELLEAAAESLRGSGFRNIFLIGESSGSQAGMRAVAGKLDAAWKDAGVRVLYIADYYTRSRAEQEAYVADRLGAGAFADVIGVAEALAVETGRVDGGSPAGATPELGRALLQIKIDHAVAEIHRLTSADGFPEAE